MKSSSVLIVGCGDLGCRSGSKLLDLGWQVGGVRRDITKLPSGFAAHQVDYTLPASLDFAEKLQPDFVLAVFNPFERSTSGYQRGFQTGMRNLLAGLGAHRPRHIIMTSSTRVFAEREGGWVDENSPLSQDDEWAQAIIGAEQQLLESGHSASVVRFAGIYGIPGGRLLSRVRRGELCPPEPLSFTNRIHRDDCGGFLAHLLFQAEAGGALVPIYVGVDDKPAPRFEVESWIAQEMGLPVSSLDLAQNQPTRHNSAGHRRCRNDALRATGYQLLYRDYTEGYGALLADH